MSFGSKFHTALRTFFRAFLLIIFTAACTPVTTPTPTLQLLAVYATPTTQPWLTEVFSCAPPAVVIRITDSPLEAQLSLRLGEPEVWARPAYQIDSEDVLVVAHRQSPVQNLSLEQTRALFAGQGDPSMQVWVYAVGEDVQEVFEQAVMEGRSLTSFARLATGPQHMADILNRDTNAIGILPRRWKAGDARVVYTIPDVPVLALAHETPRGAVQALIACLQE